MSRIRREIRVGDRVLVGSVCLRCPMIFVFFPESILDRHISEHHGVAEAPKTRYRRGRTPGSLNKYQMSATAIAYKRGIRKAR
jgi:hypothetical protein